MPILKAEPTHYPDDLFEVDDSEGLRSWSDSSDWWALYTRPRAEKSLMRRLRLAELAHYCPMMAPRRTVARPPSRVSRLPLFANYVFLRGGEQERYRSVCTGQVLRCIPVPQPDEFYQQLCAIQQMIVAGVPLELESGLQVGRQVEVKSGPLRGFRGQILKRHHQSRFLVYLNFLECGASTLLDGWDIEPL